MDKDEIKGKFQKAKGAAKENIGRAVDDPEMEAEGAAERFEGTVREGVGEIKDKAKRAIDELKK